MRKITRLLLAIPLLTIVTALQAQTNYQPARLTLKSGQQIDGLIDYREWRVNPRTISFKKEAAIDPVQYGIDDLNGFLVNGKDSFLRAIVTKDMLPVDINETSTLPDADVITENKNQLDTVFLRILLTGARISLYELVDTKSHFFISEQPGDYQELQYKVFYSHQALAIHYRQIYRDQLRPYVQGHIQETRLLRQLNRAEYREDDLLPLIAGINLQQIEKKKKNKPQFFVAAGPVYSSLKVKGNSALAYLDYSGSMGYSVGGGMDILSSRNLQDFSLRLGLFYSSLKYAGKRVDASYTLHQNNITPTVALLYNFLRRTTYKVYFGAGIHYNISSYPKNDYVTRGNENNPQKNILVFEKDWIEGTACIGGIINNTIEVSLLAKTVGNFERYIFVTAQPRIYTLRIGYRFKNK